MSEEQLDDAMIVLVMEDYHECIREEILGEIPDSLFPPKDEDSLVKRAMIHLYKVVNESKIALEDMEKVKHLFLAHVVHTLAEEEGWGDVREQEEEEKDSRYDTDRWTEYNDE